MRPLLVTLAAIAVVSAAGPAAAFPRWGQQQKLTLPGMDAGAGAVDFGAAVALSGDTAIVGAPPRVAGTPGMAFVFVRSGTTWGLQQELSSLLDGADGGMPVGFGGVVALSGDTAIVGAFTGAPGSFVGVAYVFVRSGTTWSLAQQIPDPGNGMGGDLFGASVALDGDTAIIGAPGMALVGGAAYAFVRAGSTWTLAQALDVGGTADAGLPGGFGASVALSGSKALVAAPGACPAAAYVFDWSGSAWALTGTLLPNQAQVNSFAMSGAVEGGTAVVGGSDQLFVYGLTGTWNLLELLPASGGTFGAVSLSGGTLFAGNPGDAMTKSAVAVFAPVAGQLAFQQAIVAKDPVPNDALGQALAAEGSTVVAGAPGDTAAYVFVRASSNGDACTADAECLSTHCVDGVCCTTASCPGAGECTAGEHCQPGTGTCTATPANTGKPCTADACTHDATCQGGACQGTITVCPPADACHEFGTCNPSSGQCSSPSKPDGVACPGGTCAGGVCVAPRGPPPSPAAGGCGCEVADASAGWIGWAGGCGGGAGLLLLLRRSSRGARRRRRTGVA